MKKNLKKKITTIEEKNMSQRIVIDPITRIEGHAKITINVDDSGQVTEAKFHVTEFRGFEKFCEGRPISEMPSITARICGICPVSHLLASAKAGDDILSVTIPKAAEKLRRLMNLGQIIQSHTLSFFHLSGPDLFFGMDSAPEKRNIFGLIDAEPEFARSGILLRQFGQEVIELVGGRKIHPAWAIPGGVRSPLTEQSRNHIAERIPEAKKIALNALSRFKGILDNFQKEIQFFGNFPTLFMSLVTPDGLWEHYNGKIRFVDSMGNVIADGLNTLSFINYIGEAVEPWSYMKFPYYKPLGYPDGVYRVGPLARLNVCSKIGTPTADVELAEFKERGNGSINSSFYYHYARLVEIIAALERIEILISDPDLLSNRLRARAGINQLEGIGVSEAPRGTLFHHYRVDDDGMIKKVNLIIATGQNNLAMNRCIEQIARHYIKGSKIPEGVLNRIEAGIRAFDPCLSCATHAVGKMPLQVTMYGPDGTKLDEIFRH
jgi:NAD-reducing hydrogenase large subunit